MTDKLAEIGAEGMQKTGGEFYALMAVVCLLGLGALIGWLVYLFRVKGTKVAPSCETCKDVKRVEELLNAHLGHISDNVQEFKETVREAMRESEKRQEVRFATIERKMDDGFREVYAQIHEIRGTR